MHSPAKSAPRLLEHLNSWRVLGVLLVLYTFVAGLLFVSPAPFAVSSVARVCGQPPLDTRLAGNSDEVMGFLTACGPEGRSAYRAMEVVDLFYPLLLGLLVAACSAMLLARVARRRPRLRGLAWLPLAGTALDYLENLCVWLALGSYPDAAPTNSLLGLATTAKTTVYAASWVLLVVLLAWWVIARLVDPGPQKEGKS